MIGLMRRRAMGKVILPYDAEVEFLEGTGTQWIDTGVVGIQPTDEFSIEVAMLSTSMAMVYGWSTSSRWYDLNLYHGSAYKTELAWGGSGVNIRVKPPNIGDFHLYQTSVSSNRLHFLIDGVDVGNLAVQTENNTTHGYLFGRNVSGSISNLSSLKIKKISYKRSGEYILDLIPVRKDGIGYMYDKVSHTLFGNAGTGSFIIGPDKVLPYDAEVEFLESTGTQYIDTGCQINYNSSVVVEHQATIAYTVTDVRQLHGSNGWGFWGCNANNKFESAGGSNSASSISVGTDYHDVSFIYKKENGKGHNLLYIDNVIARDVANNTISNSYDYDIFIYAIGGYNHAAAQLFSKAKIKSYKLLFDDVAVRDFIPVRKDGVGYLYDKVSRQLFGNAGTGNFILGNDV